MSQKFKLTVVASIILTLFVMRLGYEVINQNLGSWESTEQNTEHKCIGGRILADQNGTTTTTEPTTDIIFINISLTVFKSYLEIARNLIIIGVIFNCMDTLLPAIILNESITLLGFWISDKHLLNDFFYSILNSNWDMFSLIRKAASPGPDSSTNQILATNNFASFIFFNLFGEFLISAVFLLFTAFVKVNNISCKIECIRNINTKLRAQWNSYFFAIMPRICIFAGFAMNSGSAFSTGTDIMNIIIGLVLSCALIFYVGALIVQILRLNRKPMILEQSKHQTGLLKRINHLKKFEFDCLQYNCTYYPVMNYIRLMFYFISIGAATSFNYVGYGGPIISQIFIVMIEVTCSGYTKLKDCIINPISNFLLVVMQLVLVVIGLAEQIDHSNVSQTMEIVFSAFFWAVFGMSMVSFVFDFYYAWSEKKNKKPQHEEKKSKVKDVDDSMKDSDQISSSSDEHKDKENDYDPDNEKTVKIKKSVGFKNTPTFKIPQKKVAKAKLGKVL